MPAFGPHPKQFSQANANEGDIISAGVVSPTAKADPSYSPAPDPFPIGMIIDYAAATAPTGWLTCDGLAVSRTTYANLFAIVGVTWGIGDGSTTFNLPNLNRRITVGDGGVGTGTLANTVGSIGGSETHTLSIAELASHGHTIANHDHAITENFTVQFNANTVDGDEGSGTYLQSSSINSNTNTTALSPQGSWSTDDASLSAASNGSGTPHNNIQPSAVVRKLIKH